MAAQHSTTEYVLRHVCFNPQVPLQSHVKLLGVFGCSADDRILSIYGRVEAPSVIDTRDFHDIS